MSPRAGTYIIGFVGSIAALISSLWIIKMVGRRTLVLYGHAAMGLTHVFIGVSNIYGWNTCVIIAMNLFLVAYQFTSGPVAWIYAAETNIDVAVGFSILSLWGTVLVLSFVTPNLMNEDSLGPSNTFFLFAGFSFAAVIWCYFFFKETMGLSEKEKKQLYTPKRFLEQKEDKETEK